MALFASWSRYSPVAHPGPRKVSCESNLKNLATALEMYAADNHGSYPTELSVLVQQHYLKTMPTCPVAGTDTYKDYEALNRGWQHDYSVVCVGNNHGRVNFPRYNSAGGLVLP